MIKHYLQIGIVSIIVIAAIIFGFTQVGLPATQRDQKTDDTRDSSLTSLSSSINSYYYSNKKLPSSLNDIKNDIHQESILKDPETGKQYDYKIAGTNSYQLCATFKTDSTKDSDNTNSYIYISNSRKHKKGYSCFDYKVTSYNTSYKQTIKPNRCKKYGYSNESNYLVSYTAKQGDTLQSIAKEQLGDSSMANEIVLLNSDSIVDVNYSLFPGRKLYLPPKEISNYIGKWKQLNGEISKISDNSSLGGWVQWEIDSHDTFTEYVNFSKETIFKSKQKGEYKVGNCVSIVMNDHNGFIVEPQ